MKTSRLSQMGCTQLGSTAGSRAHPAQLAILVALDAGQAALDGVEGRLAADRALRLVVDQARLHLLRGEVSSGAPCVGRGKRNHHSESEHRVAGRVARIKALDQEVSEEHVLVEHATVAEQREGGR